MKTVIPDHARITFDDDGNLLGVEWWIGNAYSVIKAKQPEGLDDAESRPDMVTPPVDRC